MSFAFDRYRYPIACNAHARRGHPSMPSHPSTSIDIIRDRWNPSMSFAFDRYRYPIARSPMHPSTCIIRDRMESIERNPSNGIESNGLRSRSIDRIDRSIVAVARGRARRVGGATSDPRPRASSSAGARPPRHEVRRGLGRRRERPR